MVTLQRCFDVKQVNAQYSVYISLISNMGWIKGCSCINMCVVTTNKQPNACNMHTNNQLVNSENWFLNKGI